MKIQAQKPPPLYQKIPEVSSMNKQKYIQEIVKLMEQCSDIDLLDLIYRLLYKGRECSQ